MQRRTIQSSKAFSLVEVMISIGMILMIMIGVVKVFQFSADTISTGMAVSEVNRLQRAAQTAFPVDLRGFQRLDDPAAAPIKNGSPGMVISCSVNDPKVASGARFIDANAEAAYASKYGSSTTAMPVAATAGEVAQYSFRTDTIGFFARGGFRRKTGNMGLLGSDAGISSPLAWIWYGHLWLPDNSGAFAPATYPGAGTALNNQKNYYSGSWMLGRIAIGLQNKNYPSPALTQLALGADLQDHYSETEAPVPAMAPLGVNSQSTKVRDTATAFSVQQSRYDLAAIDPNSILATDVTKDSFGYFRERTDPGYGTSAVANWWTYLNYRYQVDPYPTKPFDPKIVGLYGGSAKMARTVPIFMPNCTNFIVDFAGDFDNDGIIDTYNDTTLTPNVRRTQWYGLPRTGATDVAPLTVGGFVKSVTATSLVCAWGGDSALATATNFNSRPKMIRITMTLRDANGRLADEQRYEYIIKLYDTY